MLLPLLLAASTPIAPYDLTQRNKADIIRQVKDDLADGESARWRWPKHQPQFGVYCGWVNAKNLMGAYVGWRPYLTIGGVGDARGSDGEYQIAKSMIAGSSPDTGNSDIVVTMCQDNGYDLSKLPDE